MHKKKPLFVTFEGIEGSGKSYQCRKLHKELRKKNLSVILTREPGGTKSAEKIRKVREQIISLESRKVILNEDLVFASDKKKLLGSSKDDIQTEINEIDRVIKNSFELIDFMPRYQKENGSFYSPPEIIRFIKLIKGKPKLKVLYDPKLEYALGNTNTYVKEEFIVSVVDEKRYGTLYLYTDLNKNDILERNEIEIKNNYFLVKISNESRYLKVKNM